MAEPPTAPKTPPAICITIFASSPIRFPKKSGFSLFFLLN